jgi:hypothetical protein
MSIGLSKEAGAGSAGASRGAGVRAHGTATGAWTRAHLLATLVGLILSWMGPAVASAQEFPRPTGYVNDFAGLLSGAERERLESFFTASDAKFGVQMTIVTMTDIGDNEPRLDPAWY